VLDNQAGDAGFQNVSSIQLGRLIAAKIKQNLRGTPLSVGLAARFKDASLIGFVAGFAAAPVPGRIGLPKPQRGHQRGSGRLDYLKTIGLGCR